MKVTTRVRPTMVLVLVSARPFSLKLMVSIYFIPKRSATIDLLFLRFQCCKIAYYILVGKYEGKRPLGRPRHR
jgi:hypothetical protein